MVINLAGILPDGSPQNPGVTQNPRTPIRVVRGADVQINVTITTPAGKPVDMTGGSTTSSFAVKQLPSDGAPKILVAGVSQQAARGNHVVQFTIPNSKWASIPAGLYGYDVRVSIGGIQDLVIPLSPFFVEETEQTVMSGASAPPPPPPSNLPFASQVFVIPNPKASDVVSINATGFHANSSNNAMPGPFTNPDVPRCVQVSFGAGWDGGAITVSGLDQFNNLQQEVIPVNAGGTQFGNQIFSTIISATKAAIGASSALATIGLGNALGIVSNGIAASLSNVNAFVMANNIPESATLSVAFNSFIPETPPDGTTSYTVVCNVP